jgi:aromatic ring hydroxylase
MLEGKTIEELYLLKYEVDKIIKEKEKNDLVEIRKLYDEAVENNKESFIWQKSEMSTAYTKYFLEFHESK